MIKQPRIVPAAILFFDCSRLLFLLTLLAAYIRPDEMIRGADFPYIMCAAPNALFPLMSFFLLIRPASPDAGASYRVFIPLYITGKCLCLLSIAIWFYSNAGWIAITGTERILWVVFLSIADLGTIMGMAVMGHDTIPEEGGC